MTNLDQKPRVPQVPREGFGHGHRHGWIDTLCSRLERVIAGRHAAAWLDATYGPLSRTSSAVFVLPAWHWAEPKIDVKRKSRSVDGGTLLLPVRLSWPVDAPVWVVARNTTQTIGWTGAGLGHSGTGSTTLVSVAADQPLDEDTYTDSDIPTLLHQSALPAHRVKARLREIVEDGRAALWEILPTLEPMVRQAIRHAHGAVAAEVDGGLNNIPPALVDAATLDRIVDEMMLGETDDLGFAHRLIDRCTTPTRFTNVDPLKFVVDAVNSEAETAIRRELGDPHIGRKIRALARELGTRDVSRVITEYRARYPKDRLADRRAEAAMTVAPLVTASATNLDDLCGVVGTTSDDGELLAMLDREVSMRRRGPSLRAGNES